MKSNLRNYRIILWDFENDDLDEHTIQFRSNNYVLDIIKYNLLTLFIWLIYICYLVINYSKLSDNDLYVAYGFGLFLLIGTLVLFIASLKFYGWKEFLNGTNNLDSFKTKEDAEKYVSNLIKNDNIIHKLKNVPKKVV